MAENITGSIPSDINRFRSDTGKEFTAKRMSFAYIIRTTKLLENKDDNIHKSEALKREDKRTLTLLKCQN